MTNSSPARPPDATAKPQSTNPDLADAPIKGAGGTSGSQQAKFSATGGTNAAASSADLANRAWMVSTLDGLQALLDLINRLPPEQRAEPIEPLFYRINHIEPKHDRLEALNQVCDALANRVANVRTLDGLRRFLGIMHMPPSNSKPG